MTERLMFLDQYPNAAELAEEREATIAGLRDRISELEEECNVLRKAIQAIRTQCERAT